MKYPAPKRLSRTNWNKFPRFRRWRIDKIIQIPSGGIRYHASVTYRKWRWGGWRMERIMCIRTSSIVPFWAPERIRPAWPAGFNIFAVERNDELTDTPLLETFTSSSGQVAVTTSANHILWRLNEQRSCQISRSIIGDTLAVKGAVVVRLVLNITLYRFLIWRCVKATRIIWTMILQTMGRGLSRQQQLFQNSVILAWWRQKSGFQRIWQYLMVAFVFTIAKRVASIILQALPWKYILGRIIGHLWSRRKITLKTKWK